MRSKWLSREWLIGLIGLIGLIALYAGSGFFAVEETPQRSITPVQGESISSATPQGGPRVSQIDREVISAQSEPIESIVEPWFLEVAFLAEFKLNPAVDAAVSWKNRLGQIKEIKVGESGTVELPKEVVDFSCHWRGLVFAASVDDCDIIRDRTRRFLIRPVASVTFTLEREGIYEGHEFIVVVNKERVERGHREVCRTMPRGVFRGEETHILWKKLVVPALSRLSFSVQVDGSNVVEESFGPLLIGEDMEKSIRLLDVSHKLLRLNFVPISILPYREGPQVMRVTGIYFKNDQRGGIRNVQKMGSLPTSVEIPIIPGLSYLVLCIAEEYAPVEMVVDTKMQQMVFEVDIKVPAAGRISFTGMTVDNNSPVPLTQAHVRGWSTAYSPAVKFDGGILTVVGVGELVESMTIGNTLFPIEIDNGEHKFIAWPPPNSMILKEVVLDIRTEGKPLTEFELKFFSGKVVVGTERIQSFTPSGERRFIWSGLLPEGETSVVLVSEKVKLTGKVRIGDDIERAPIVVTMEKQK